MEDLATRKCKPCESGVDPLKPQEIENLLSALNGWSIIDGAVSKTFTFKNHHQALAFVNAVAWISHREDHHPDMSVGYNSCRIAYVTHAINGLSQNDFICAAKVDALFDL